MGFQVERSSLFKGPKGITLKYKEYSPNVPDACQDTNCNCTRLVDDRPHGEPDYVWQGINYIGTFSSYNLKWCLNREHFDLYFYWDEKPYEKGFRWHNPHAYFSFDRKISKKSANSIGVAVTSSHQEELQRMQVDLLTDMYFGNNIDISHMMNGHSPSKIVKLKDIKPEDVWVHYCIGGEAMEIFSPSEEANMWKGIYKEGARVMDITDAYVADKERSVDEIRCDVVTNFELIGLVDNLKKRLSSVLDNLKDTELYRLGNKVSEEVRARW